MHASVIGGQANQLSGLVEQILLFAATREGRQRYTLRLLGVNEIIDAALANTTGMIRVQPNSRWNRKLIRDCPE